MLLLKHKWISRMLPTASTQATPLIILRFSPFRSTCFRLTFSRLPHLLRPIE